MRFEPCIPTTSKKVPDHPDWIHEIKQDGYRLLVRRNHDQVKLITRNGHDWTKRYPWIVDAARRIGTQQFVLDGEACILGVDGVAAAYLLEPTRHQGIVLSVRCVGVAYAWILDTIDRSDPS